MRFHYYEDGSAGKVHPFSTPEKNSICLLAPFSLCRHLVEYMQSPHLYKNEKNRKAAK